MTVILSFSPSLTRQRRIADARPETPGEVVFFTGVRYERLATMASVKPAPQPTPSKPQRLKSKA